jgi:hypothetical protein
LTHQPALAELAEPTASGGKIPNSPRFRFASVPT